MKCETPWQVRDPEAFALTVAAAFPNGEWLAAAVVQQFHAEIRVHAAGCSAAMLSAALPQVWQYGQVYILYRILPATQQVEVLSVGNGEIAGLDEWIRYYSELSWRPTRKSDRG